MTSSAEAGKPFAHSKATQYISRQIDAMVNSGAKTQFQIANEVGWDRPNFLSMIKHGKSRIPLDKVAALAKALAIDAGFLLRLVMQDHWPDQHKVIAEIMPLGTLSRNELAILAHIREVSSNSDPELTAERQAMLTQIFAS